MLQNKAIVDSSHSRHHHHDIPRSNTTTNITNLAQPSHQAQHISHLIPHQQPPPPLLTQTREKKERMCKLTSILTSTCHHPLKIEWVLCPSAPLPHRCPILTISIDSSALDPHTPYCTKCAAALKQRLIADFRDERRERTRVARASEWTDRDVSRLRVGLRDRLYERLRYVDKPLPGLPGGGG